MVCDAAGEAATVGPGLAATEGGVERTAAGDADAALASGDADPLGDGPTPAPATHAATRLDATTPPNTSTAALAIMVRV